MAYRGKKLADMNAQERAARIAQLARSGNTAAIPTKYLTGDLAKVAKQRALRVRLDTPVTEGSTMTNRDLAHEANAAIGVQYGPQEQALNQQLASAAQQPRVTGGYYDAYIETLRQAGRDQATRSQAAIDQFGNVAKQGQDTATAQNSQIIGQLQTDAAQRGAVVDPGVAERAGQAAQINRNVANTYTGQEALRAGSQQTLLAGLIGAAGAGKLQALNKVASDTLDLKNKKTQLKREEGQANLQYRSKRRSEEVQNVATTALATGKQLNADSQFSKATGYTPDQWAQMTPAERRTALAKVAKATHPPKPTKPAADQPYKYGYTKKEWLALPLATRQRITKENAAKGKDPKAPRPTSGPGSASPAAEAKFVSQITRAASYLHDKKIPVKDANGNPSYKAAKDRGQVIAWLKGNGIDPRVLQVANSLAANDLKGVGHRGVKGAHELGIHVGGHWKIINGPPKKKGTGSGAGAAVGKQA